MTINRGWDISHLSVEDSDGGGVSNSHGSDGVSNDGGGVDDGADSVSNNRGGVSNNGGGVDDGGVGDSDGADSVSDDGGVGSDSNGGSVGRLAGVADVLDDAVSVVRVGHGLDPAVGEVDGVAAGGGVSVPLLGLGEGGSAVVISHTIVVGVDWGLGEVTSGVTGGGGHNNASGEGGGDREESGTDESL